MDQLFKKLGWNWICLASLHLMSAGRWRQLWLHESMQNPIGEICYAFLFLSIKKEMSILYYFNLFYLYNICFQVCGPLMATWTLKSSTSLSVWWILFQYDSKSWRFLHCFLAMLPRCNIDPNKLAGPEVFAPVGIKRFIGGLGAWFFCDAQGIQKLFAFNGRHSLCWILWNLRSNEVLFPPQTKFRVKEDGRVCILQILSHLKPLAFVWMSCWDTSIRRYNYPDWLCDREDCTATQHHNAFFKSNFIDFSCETELQGAL